MAVNIAESSFNDPRYREILLLFQRGKWRTGMAELDRLIETYPLDHELRALRQEMVLRAHIDLDERADRVSQRRQRLKNLVVRSSLLVFTVFLIIWSIRSYSTWIQNRWADTRARLEDEFQVVEVAVKFRNAQDLLQAGRTTEARALFMEIAEEDPTYPELDTYLAQADEMAVLDQQYEEAMGLIAQGDSPAALLILNRIAEQRPFYKDISIQIDNVQNQMLLDHLRAQANAAYDEGRWADAVSEYENIQALDLQYRSDEIEERLYRSYLNAAQAALDQEADSLEALEVAEGYFRKALALRPQDQEALVIRAQARATIEDRLVGSYVSNAQLVLADQSDSLEALTIAEGYLLKALSIRPDDQEIKLQLQLAQLYLGAQANFNQGLWSEVITDLETVYVNDMEYARGTARQTLYDAYQARADNAMASGEYEAALSDYQRAAVLAKQGPESVFRLYESQIKVANAHGILGNYENAVLLYRSAVDLGGIEERAQEDNPVLAASLFQAEAYAEQGNHRLAYRHYREALRRADETYDTIVHKVQSGEYLTLLAGRYHSTVQAIAMANDIANPNRIFTGQELLIPVLP